MPAEVITSSHVQKGNPNYSASFAVKTKVETVGIGEELRLNLEYFKSIPGIIKIVELVCNLLCQIKLLNLFESLICLKVWDFNPNL